MMMSTSRRTMIKRSAVWLGAPGLMVAAAGCGQGIFNGRGGEDPDAELKRKFRGIYGGEKRIDAFESLIRVVLLTEDNLIFAAGVFGRGGKISHYGGAVPGDRLPIPRTLRYVRYSDEAKFITRHSWPMYEGEPLVDVTVPVASRIPDDLLRDLRRDPKGSLRLKIRLMRDAILIGWDIERRPGFDPRKRDRYGQIAYVAPVHSFAGGDFREAKIYNGKPVRMGWYVDPKTGERIETNF